MKDNRLIKRCLRELNVCILVYPLMILIVGVVGFIYWKDFITTSDYHGVLILLVLSVVLVVLVHSLFA